MKITSAFPYFVSMVLLILVHNTDQLDRMSVQSVIAGCFCLLFFCKGYAIAQEALDDTPKPPTTRVIKDFTKLS